MLDDYYEILKVLHVISVISWMAAMFYLPRLFVYHAGVEVGSDSDKMLQIMETRLLRIIMNPAMISTLIFGLLVSDIYGFSALGMWFHIKMFAVLVLLALHGFFAKCRKEFARGKNKHSPFFFRVLNEIPVLLMIICVAMVIIKPFD